MNKNKRARRNLFALLMAAATAIAVLLAACGLAVPGCILFAAAFFAFGIPSIIYNEKLRRPAAEKSVAPEEQPVPEPKPAAKNTLLLIVPLSAGLSKSMLYYDPAGKQCIIRYPHSGHEKIISVAEAAGMLAEEGARFALETLGKKTGYDVDLALARAACVSDARHKEVRRLPAEGEIRQRSDPMGRLTEVYTGGTWVPDAERSVIAEGMHDHFTAYRLQMENLSRQPKPRRFDRSRYDKSLNRYYWTVPLQQSGPCFLTMVFGGDKKLLHYSFDVETANDSHYILPPDNAAQLRLLLTGPKPTYWQNSRALNRLMTDFLKDHSVSELESKVKKVCSKQFHY